MICFELSRMQAFTWSPYSYLSICIFHTCLLTLGKQKFNSQVAASMQKDANIHIPNYPNLPSKLICLLHSIRLHVGHCVLHFSTFFHIVANCSDEVPLLFFFLGEFIHQGYNFLFLVIYRQMQRQTKCMLR